MNNLKIPTGYVLPINKDLLPIEGWTVLDGTNGTPDLSETHITGNTDSNLVLCIKNWPEFHKSNPEWKFGEQYGGRAEPVQGLGLGTF
jgi:hypothetical protein